MSLSTEPDTLIDSNSCPQLFCKIATLYNATQVFSPLPGTFWRTFNAATLNSKASLCRFWAWITSLFNHSISTLKYLHMGYRIYPEKRGFSDSRKHLSEKLFIDGHFSASPLVSLVYPIGARCQACFYMTCSPQNDGCRYGIKCVSFVYTAKVW